MIGDTSEEFAYEFFIRLKNASVMKKIEEKSSAAEEREKTKEMRFIRPLVRQIHRMPTQIKRVALKEPEKAEKQPALSKIEGMMKDTVVNSIECSGTNQKVMIKRGNRIIETPIKLDKEEIKEIIKSISDESKVPLKKVFKARFRDFKVNAIISDFIEPRFILRR